MTTTPPVPQANQSPYPIEEPPHPHASAPAPETAQEEAPESETVKAVKAIQQAKERWEPDAKQIGLGAAVGIGSAAIVAGLLYWRGGRKDGKDHKGKK